MPVCKIGRISSESVLETDSKFSFNYEQSLLDSLLLAQANLLHPRLSSLFQLKQSTMVIFLLLILAVGQVFMEWSSQI